MNQGSAGIATQTHAGSFADRLPELCEVIVDRNGFPGPLAQATHELYDRAVRESGLRPEWSDAVVAAETSLANGVAISPMEAAHCALDPFRTRAFSIGVREAIAERRRLDGSRPVHVLYAGCGPFATLLLPSLVRFGPDEVQCTLLDVHERSIAAVGRVLTAAGLGAHVRRVERADATSFVVPPDDPVDVIVAECMLRGLSREPQVAITWNLVAQCGPEVILVPEAIRLELVAISERALTSEPQPEMRRVGDRPVFVLSAESVRGWGPVDPDSETVPAGTTTVTSAPLAGDVLALAAAIRVRDGVTLSDFETGLTRPLLLDVPGPVARGTELQFGYRLTTPGIEVLGVSEPR